MTYKAQKSQKTINPQKLKLKKNNNIRNEEKKNDTSSVIYGTEKESLKYLGPFISNHRKMPDKEIHSLACRYFYLNQQLIYLRKRIEETESKMEKVTDNVSKFLLETEKDELLSLIKMAKYEESCKEIRDILICHNLRLLIKIADRYSDFGISLDDLIQEAVTGFIHAIDRYDPSNHVKLSTYSTWWIRQKIVRSLSNKARLIRLPVHLTTDITKVLGAIKRNKIPFSPANLKKISEMTKLPEDKVAFAFSHVYSWRPYNQFDISTSSDVDPVEKIVDNYKQSNHLEEVSLELDVLNFVKHFISTLDILEPFEKEYLCRKYGLNGYPKMDLLAFKQWYRDSCGGTTKSYTVTKKIIYQKLLTSFFP